jgi:outer membrane receptor protein involved in Fe transport
MPPAGSRAKNADWREDFMIRLDWKAVCLCAASMATIAQAHAQTGPQVAATTDVVVITATPLDGADVDPRKLPAPVQQATARDIADSNALDLSAFMNRRLGSVYINDIQNNPLQPDVNYRGYTASPLLGTPQGLSLYVDGVRLNQPFGDVVSWDLIPKDAIETVTLMPGSNPLFGLNTLGGALSVRTKSGITAPGSSIEASYGSNNRWQAQASTGGKSGAVNWFVTGNHFEDDGWRDASPSKASQLFAKIGWSDAQTNVSLSASFADTNLTGNGLQEQRFLARDYKSIYTKPDITRNKAGLVNLTGTQELSDHLRFSGNAYYRNITSSTLNGDLNDDSLTESVYQPNAAERAALAAAGYTGFPAAGENAANTPFPRWRCIANILLNAEPGEKCNGLLNRSHTNQNESGFAGQLTFDQPLGSFANQFTAGVAYNASHADFGQTTQYGYLTADRGIATVNGPGAFADGTQDSENALDARVDLTGVTHVYSIFATDTLELAPALNMTVSARYDRTQIKNRDAITPSGSGSLTADHDFDRVNPAIGLTWSPNDALTTYLGYTESSRAPSAIELGCSDPANPCRLPNALAGDPPLDQVVTRTIEAGASGKFGVIGWNAGVFHGENSDDIMFVADDPSGSGYFRNFGKTRRQGVELGLNADLGTITLGANYTYLDATYRSEEEVSGQGNSTNNVGAGFEGTIIVSPGDRIPLVPKQILKANARWEISNQFAIEADAIGVDSSYARGNENNQHQPDGVFYLGEGKSGRYGVMNIGADYRPTPSIKLFVQVNNVFDTKYSTGAQLGATGFTDTGAFVARPFAGPIIDGERPTRNATFYAPGAPRLFWVGVKYGF